MAKFNEKTDGKNDEFTPKILKLKEKIMKKPHLGGPDLYDMPRCTFNGPPPCPPMPKCQK